VGPEGGFTPAELDAMQARPFVTSVSLGPRILRAETACIVGLALLQATDRG
jgi:16S rRNA (uracil1498-N3)-methyltransferase